MIYKLPKFTFLFSALICVALRIIIKLTAVSPVTGYYNGSTALTGSFTAILVVSILIILCAGLLQRPGEKRVSYSPLFRVTYILAGVAALVMDYTWVLKFLDDISWFETPQTIDALVCIVLAVPCAFIMIWMGIRLKKDSSSSKINSVLPLIPVIWQIYMLLSKFMSYTATRNMSDQLLVIVMLILLTPYLLAHGRMAGNLTLQKSANHAVGFGLCFALVAITYSAGTIAAIAANVDHGYALNLAECVFYLLLGINAASFACAVKK